MTSVTTTMTPVKMIAIFLIFGFGTQMCNSSAIPIWEFLSRSEKLSYLYSTFAQMVSSHCKTTAGTTELPVNQCKRNLLSGYEKLQTFSDAQLDAFDPYQRGANELIWTAIMNNNPSAALITTTSHPLPTPPSSSIVILTHQKPIGDDAHSHALPKATATTIQQYPNNPIFETDAEHKHKFAMDMDIAYGYPGRPAVNTEVASFGNSAVHPSHHSTQQTYLTGPLVFRVRPDGTPVDEDRNRPLPRDEDLDFFQASGSVASSIAQPNSSGRQNKHRKIATISALKQQFAAGNYYKRFV